VARSTGWRYCHGMNQDHEERIAANGTTEIQCSMGEISGAHVFEATALWLQTMVPLTAGDTVELQCNFRAADGYFAADYTSFWGAKAD